MQDHQLLAEFAQAGSQEAFAELVHRYAGAVYSSARRQLGDVQAAEDVTQAVFVILARKAKTLVSTPSLAGWIMKTTYFACRDARRTQARRRRHEEAAALLAQRREHAMGISTNDGQIEELSGELDQALSALRDSDRSALTLRYLREMTVAQTADALGISQYAAAKRISRALETLRRRLVRSRVIIPAASIGLMMEGVPRFGASPALAASAISATMAAGSAAPMSIAKGTMNMMKWIKIKAAILLLGCTAVAASAGVGLLTSLQEAPPAPAPAAGAAPAPAPVADAPALASDPFGGTVAALSNGVSMELLGVGEKDAGGLKWWRADGTELTVAPYAREMARGVSGSMGVTRDFAVRFNLKVASSSDAADVTWRLAGSTSSTSGTTSHPYYPDLWAQEIALADDPAGATIHADIASGKWMTQYTMNGNDGGSESTAGLFSNTSFLVSSAFDKGGRTHVVYIESGVDGQVRIIARDLGGKIHPTQMVMGSSNSTAFVGEVSINLPLAQIKGWELQSRPYDQWIEIRHVALHADQATDVKIVTSDDPGASPTQ